MLAIVGGSLALLLGFLALLLPLLATELSRPRDAFWGAVVLLLGLVLVTSADRLTGAPMLAVLCGGLLIGRLGSEVVQLRWSQLTAEEQARLGSTERWRTGFGELATALARLVAQAAAALQVIGGSLRSAVAAKPRSTAKRWVRPEPSLPDTPMETPEETPGPSAPNALEEPPVEQTTTGGTTAAAANPAPQEGDQDPGVIDVGSFAEIDSLVRQQSHQRVPGATDSLEPAEGR